MITDTDFEDLPTGLKQRSKDTAIKLAIICKLLDLLFDMNNDICYNSRNYYLKANKVEITYSFNNIKTPHAIATQSQDNQICQYTE